MEIWKIMIEHVEKYQDSSALLAGASVAFGVFDGVHEGHRFEISQIVKDARQQNSSAENDAKIPTSKKAVIVTFDKDPDEVFIKGFMKLMSNEERIEQIAKSGVDDVVVLKFDEGLRSAGSEEFLDGFFGKNLPHSIHVGENFCFGYKKQGTVEVLKEWGRKHGVRICVHGLLEKDGHVVSSTRIRQERAGWV